MLQQALAAVLIIGFAGSALWLSSHTLDRQEARYLLDTARRIAAGVEREWHEEGDLAKGARAELDEDPASGVIVRVLDAQGRLIASNTPLGSAPPPGERREVRVPVPSGGWVLAAISRRPHADAVAALGMALLLSGVPVLIIAAIASRAIARRALRPLSRMAEVAQRASETGSVAALGLATDPEEITNLSASFNRLLARLDEMLKAEQHFTQDAAHELRTPLTVVAGEIEYALAMPTLPERQRQGLVNASSQVQAMSELVEALLFLRRTDASRIGAEVEFAPVDLAELTRETTAELLRNFPSRTDDVKLRTTDEVLVAGHAVLLASALRNLLANALKFTRTGQPIEVTVLTSSDECVVVVEDAGPGIAPAERERVFDAFYRDAEARASHDGFGLGLHILRRVARAHGGDVRALASDLGGARFELRLPAWSPADAAVPARNWRRR